MNYKNYLQTEHWKRFRQGVLAFWSNSCALCSGTSSLEVHHRHYNSLGRERMTDCIPLCAYCHEKQHQSLHTSRCLSDSEMQRLEVEGCILSSTYHDLKKASRGRPTPEVQIRLADLKDDIEENQRIRDLRRAELDPSNLG